MPHENERRPSDRSESKSGSTGMGSEQFRQEFEAFGSSSNRNKIQFDERSEPFQTVGSAPPGGFGKTFTGADPMGQADRPVKEIKSSLADQVREQKRRGLLTDPALLRVAETIDQLVQTRVAQETTELAAKLRITERTLTDLAGVANIATERITQAEKAQKAAEIRAEKAERTTLDLADKLELEKIARINAEARARIAEEETRRIRSSSPASTPDNPWDPRGYYKMLGVNDPTTARKVTTAQLQRLFKAQSMVHHPDQGGDTSQMQKLSAAFNFLQDPLSRRSYGR